MNARPEVWRKLSLVLALFVILGCASMGAIQPTDTPAVPGSGGENGGAGSGGAGSGNSIQNPNSKNPLPINTLEVTTTPTVTPTPDAFAGPFSVRQTMTLGKEHLGSPPGGICVNTPWQVPADTPKVSFVFNFAPYSALPGATGNTVGYTYNIASAGESHQAQGSYTLSPNEDGSTRVSLKIRDHVVFKGFDGNIPVRYSFDLVPIHGNSFCP